MPPTLLSRAERLKPFLCLHPPECLAVLDWGFLPVFERSSVKLSNILSNVFY